MRLLIIDDEEDTLLLLQLLLQKKGFEVNVLSSGYKALEKAEQYDPDIILLDVKLDDDNDGRDICRRLKSNDKTNKSKVYLCSAHASMLEQAGVGADGFIHKPFNIKKLVETISR